MLFINNSNDSRYKSLFKEKKKKVRNKKERKNQLGALKNLCHN